MLYREAGDFKTTYAADAQTFPLRFDRVAFRLLLPVAFLLVPLVITPYWSNAVLLPFLIWSIAALGLNILTGYCGQLSLGTGGFMAVGAFTAFKLLTAYPELNIAFAVILAGFTTALVGVAFGLPSLRIKGFYLAVATLAAQFFLLWLFNRVPWFFNYSATGQITVPTREIFSWEVTGASAAPAAKYLFCLVLTFLLALIAKNLVRGRVGRSWMAIRDMDIAAEIIGVNPLTAKLSAFAVSSFYVGVAGALYFAVYFGAVEVTDAFSIRVSFFVLFMIIIGGLGSVLGAFLGAGFMVLMPLFLKNLMVGTLDWPTDLAAHIEFMLLGILIMGFLIAEPHGLARLWQLAKEKLRLWPFPH